MNIMLANVAERTREIGIRRALGATRRDIMIQFLAEAVLLTAVGGVLGVFLGVAASFVVSMYAGWATGIAWWVPVAALSLAAATGLGFGLYPAWLAAGRSPMESLRYE